MKHFDPRRSFEQDDRMQFRPELMAGGMSALVRVMRTFLQSSIRHEAIYRDSKPNRNRLQAYNVFNVNIVFIEFSIVWDSWRRTEVPACFQRDNSRNYLGIVSISFVEAERRAALHINMRSRSIACPELYGVSRPNCRPYIQHRTSHLTSSKRSAKREKRQNAIFQDAFQEMTILENGTRKLNLTKVEVGERGVRECDILQGDCGTETGVCHRASECRVGEGKNFKCSQDIRAGFFKVRGRLPLLHMVLGGIPRSSANFFVQRTSCMFNQIFQYSAGRLPILLWRLCCNITKNCYSTNPRGSRATLQQFQSFLKSGCNFGCASLSERSSGVLKIASRYIGVECKKNESDDCDYKGEPSNIPQKCRLRIGPPPFSARYQHGPDDHSHKAPENVFVFQAGLICWRFGHLVANRIVLRCGVAT